MLFDIYEAKLYNSFLAENEGCKHYSLFDVSHSSGIDDISSTLIGALSVPDEWEIGYNKLEEMCFVFNNKIVLIADSIDLTNLPQGVEFLKHNLDGKDFKEFFESNLFSNKIED